jgi:hypothetical protein
VNTISKSRLMTARAMALVLDTIGRKVGRVALHCYIHILGQRGGTARRGSTSRFITRAGNPLLSRRVRGAVRQAGGTQKRELDLQPHQSAEGEPGRAAARRARRRGTQERTGGELEQQRPTTSTRVGSLECSTATRKLDRPVKNHDRPARCHIFVTRDVRRPQFLVTGACNPLNLEFSWSAA